MATINRFQHTLIRFFLGLLLGILALNAFGGGIYGLFGAEGVPIELLEGSPFKNYFIPSLVLFVVVGGLSLTASIAVFARSIYAKKISFGVVLTVFIWLSVQVVIIGYVSWMQPATAIAALVILSLALLLPEEKKQPDTRY